jgi:putative oxygen-independent coproporphyrinogen III oxidase
MAGVYIHIPFCKQACHYCNFHFSTLLKGKNEFLAALLKEIDLRKSYLLGEKIETIYFGGGTPSLFSSEEIKSILDKLRGSFEIIQDLEITLEANPDDLTIDLLSGLKDSGINRLSIGIQSFFEEDLRWMNRAHSAEQSMECIQNAREVGFNNLSIDLIYGSPTLTDDKWKRNVDLAVALKIPHLSCYALTVEPRTALDSMIKKNKVQDIDPDIQARQFLQLINWLGDAEYEHYEISNFAIPGKRSRHNSSYWQGKKYLGLGPSAHSFNGHSREWNVSNNAIYAKSILDGIIPSSSEELTSTQQLNEYIMTSIRTSEGTNLEIIRERFGENAAAETGKKTDQYIKRELAFQKDKSIILTTEGKLFADRIAAELFHPLS